MPSRVEPNSVALLEWYCAMGADEALAAEPTDWLARGNVPPGQSFAWPGSQTAIREAVVTPAGDAIPNPRPAVRQFPVAPPGDAELAAREAARAAPTLSALAATLADFDGCALRATAKNLCFYRGSPKARIMMIGEAPGREEDLEGRPFVGRAGQLLDRMLAAAELTEADVHITNIVYWRPPGNRAPTPQEAQVCRPFMERQLELVAPEFVVLLGGAAAKHVLDIAEGILRIRGKWRDLAIGTLRAKAMATLHPAYLLRTPAAKRLAWRDLLAVRAAFDAKT